MQPSVRSLEQILGELNPIYQPQESLIRQRQADIPVQIQAEEQGLQAKQGQAFEDIVGGARRRGIGFSGIPLQEQAKYTSTEYLPALARLRTAGRQQAQSLEEAVLGINERKQTAALGMRQYEQQRYDQYMAQLRAEEEARQQRAAARASAFSPTMGTTPEIRNSSVPNQSPEDKAYLSAQQFLATKDNAAIRSDFAATLVSANRGNAVDKLKIIAYQKARPDLFGAPAAMAQKGINSGGLSQVGFGTTPYNSGVVSNGGVDFGRLRFGT